jgi:hypothetical protein
MGLGWGPCWHCGKTQYFDSFRWFHGRFFCRRLECDDQAHAWMVQHEQMILACREKERLELELWKAKDDARQMRWAQEEQFLIEEHRKKEAIRLQEKLAAEKLCVPHFPRIACTRCFCITDRLRLQNENLLCCACVSRERV